MIYKKVAEPMSEADALHYLTQHGATDPAHTLRDLNRLAQALTSGEAFRIFTTISRQTPAKTYLNLYVDCFPIEDTDGTLGAGRYKGTGRPHTFKCDSPNAVQRYNTFQKLAYILEHTHGLRADFSTVPLL